MAIDRTSAKSTYINKIGQASLPKETHLWKFRSLELNTDEA